MKKRIYMVLSAVLAVSVLVGCSQGKNGYVVGINQFAPHPSLDNCKNGFVEGLHSEGFVEGENLTIKFSNAGADMATANSISSGFVSQKVDLICGIATPSAQSAYNAASEKKIPTVFSAVSDPVAASLVKSLGKPGNNATGTSDALPVEAQLKMIRAFLPDAEKIGIIYTTSEVNSQINIETYKALAPGYGFEIVEKGISIAADIPMTADSMLTEVDCITNLTDNTVVTSLAIIIEKANEKNIPVFGSEEEQLKLGCVAAEGLDYYKLGIETGKIAARVLKGEKAADIPVAVIAASRTYINMEALAALGIEIPADYAGAENIEME